MIRSKTLSLSNGRLTLLALSLLLANPAPAARDFNGSSSYLVATPFVVSLPLTIGMWYYNDNTTTQYTLYFIGKNDASTGYYGNYRASTTDKPWGILHLDGGGGAESRVTPGITAVGWNHVAAVYSSTTSRTAYLNGSAGVENTALKGDVTTERLVLGVYGNLSAGFLDGKLAEVGVWSVALSPPELAALARGISPLLVRPASLVFYAPLARDLIDFRAARTWTDNSTAIGDHPRVYR